MRVNVTELGGGLTRLDIEPTCGCEPRIIPTHVADDIMRDVVRREKSCAQTPRWSRPVATRPCCPTFVPTASWERPLPTPPNREPDGIDIHVDRPQRQNYGGIPWAAEDAYRKDLAKYRSLEALAKKCDWPAREPMKGAPNYRNLSAQRPQTQCIGVPAPQPRPWLEGMPRPTVCSSRESVAIRNAMAALEELANEWL